MAAVPSQELLYLIVLGLAAGVMGGMLGIGGSIIMIPVLTVVLGKDQQLSQAAAMIVNFFVATPALLRHRRAKMVRWDVVWRMLPFTLAFIIVGVLLSNKLEGDVLKKVFGVFLLYIVAMNVVKFIGRAPEPHHHEQRVGLPATGSVGGVMGFMSGLLGIGGGGIAVPLLQRVCNLPLRQCIATSTAVMCLTTSIGAALKNYTLSGLVAGVEVTDSLLIAACLAPTAFLGGMIGAHLTHSLNLRWVRLAFIIIMMWASLNMLGIVKMSQMDNGDSEPSATEVTLWI